VVRPRCGTAPYPRQLAEAGADAPRREARNIVLNYARRIEHAEASARRFVAAGLNELSPIIESLWPNQLPEDLSRGAMKALDAEKSPETAALLAAFVESLGRIAVNRGDYSGFETILTGLERAPHDKEHDHMSALAHRLVAQDRWLCSWMPLLPTALWILSCPGCCSAIRAAARSHDSASD